LQPFVSDFCNKQLAIKSHGYIMRQIHLAWFTAKGRITIDQATLQIQLNELTAFNTARNFV
jgi:prophage antirepressor-like protein